MTRLEDLTLKSADDSLRPSEGRELHSLLEADSQAAREHLALLSLEAALRATRKDFDLCDSILARLERERAESIEAKVMSEIQFEAPPKWHPRAIRRPSFFTARPSTARVLALAAGIVLLISLGVWFFGPTMGEPILAIVNGADVSIERRLESIAASAGTRLQPEDVLRTGKNGAATIAFGKEKTTIELAAETDMKFSSFTKGKHLQLRIGQLKASVARQRPFQPTIIATPQAEARVLGTVFTLLATGDTTRLDVTEGKVKFTRASDGKTVKVGAGNHSVAAANSELSVLPATGRILREYWTNLANNSLASAGSTLKSKRSVVARPDGFDYLPRFESMPLRRGLRITERIRGYVQPPKTGLYRFALTTVHVETALRLSRTDRPEDVVQVAFQTPDSRVGPSLQKVTPVPLQAGRKYYVEVVHESDGGDDQLAVTWQAPGGEPEIIPGKFLSPFPTQEKKGQR